jgi:hypothetical protein
MKKDSQHTVDQGYRMVGGPGDKRKNSKRRVASGKDVGTTVDSMP